MNVPKHHQARPHTRYLGVEVLASRAVEALLVEMHISGAVGDENVGVTRNRTLSRVRIRGILKGGDAIARGQRTTKNQELTESGAVTASD